MVKSICKYALKALKYANHLKTLNIDEQNIISNLYSKELRIFLVFTYM